eukprot:TRINITY_DN8785_c0_g1_i1.p1 TRINITY_DN8785_c0_g1~~TRINITY_DN8785_c0_g1_i1.p1  ORF type:complete len:168 (+),score=13.94 TRINITY_DN8785_c0_g1_i1:38-541(+)
MATMRPNECALASVAREKAMYIHPRIPFSTNQAKILDRFQRKLCAYLLPLQVDGFADVGAAKRARYRKAGVFCREAGLWSHAWAKRVVDWQQHVARAHSQWAKLQAALVSWHGADWIKKRRALTLSGRNYSETLNFGATRTDTRATSGFVAKRWTESVIDAKAVISS